MSASSPQALLNHASNAWFSDIQGKSPAEAGDGIICTGIGQTVPVMTSVAVPGVTVKVPSAFCVNEAAGTVI